MARRRRITGEWLNIAYRLGAAQSRYREDGTWYHPLRRFPGVLFDGGGYVRFESPVRTFRHSDLRAVFG